MNTLPTIGETSASGPLCRSALAPMSHPPSTSGADAPTPGTVSSRIIRRHLDGTRSPEFWYHDGSIVLLLDDQMFRVHQTVLAAHSEVFAGLFTLPQPAPAPSASAKGEMIEGCHVVQLHDSAADFADLLKAIYRPGYFDAPPEDLTDLLPFLGGILRLSTKYLITTLRARCVALLKAKFPTTFAEYAGLARRHYKSDDVMRAARLAQECTVREVLPYIYYCIARMGLSRIVAEPDDPDISWRDKAICLVGRERLRWAEMSLSHSFLFAFQPAPGCTAPLQCAVARGPHKEWRLLEAARAPNPLKAWTKWEALNVCGECVAQAQKQHQAGREEVWGHLPVIFEMPAWGELLRP
ncbi:Zn-dependent hydrolase oxidoreductase family [Mycena kentingensis (nom. inval.)]|nr:Zn-dependent hydrolase oxidoreductase family [Mycena kentingensis (nom. inval.)]